MLSRSPRLSLLLMYLILMVMADRGELWAQEAQIVSDEGGATDYVDVIASPKGSSLIEGRATERVGARRIRQQLSRSAPESLQGALGTYVQQTAHGQASAYIRGRTGRHTLLMIDGFRLNHALFRQGPNQYLFTIEPLSIHAIEVLRGGGSVTLGANALSGAVLVNTAIPQIDPYQEETIARPQLNLLSSTADRGVGGRASLDLQLSPRWGIYVGASGVNRESLEASGPLPISPGTPVVLVEEKEVPRFYPNGRIQRGTGYEALSGDLVARWRGGEGVDWVSAVRTFRQFNSPRTDRCPPPEAPDTWCLTYDEQFRTHAYTRLRLKPKLMLAHKAYAGLSYQRQHERRTNDRESYINGGRDAVDVWELRLGGSTSPFDLLKGTLTLEYGLDGTTEGVESKAWDTLVRSQITRIRSRGQYLEGSAYHRGAIWLNQRLQVSDLNFRLGARVTRAWAEAPGDEESESQAVDRGWLGMAFGGGMEWRVTPSATLFVNLDEGFAPPNLDDLTARQLTGQGFQIENPLLGPEQALTGELGTRLSLKQLTAELWAFSTRLTDGIERRDTTCPASDRSCRAARVATPFQLVNLPDVAWIYGGEGRLIIPLVFGLSLSQRASLTWGEGPSPLKSERGTSRPLSRIPPINGAISLGWKSPLDQFYTRFESRWALAQDRLSFGDEIDHRIPYGGTPGYLTHNLYLGMSAEGVELNLLVENITDQIYRIHGSSVNGAGRSLSLLLSYTPSL